MTSLDPTTTVNLQVNDLGQQKGWAIGPGLPLQARQGRV
jgi:hypothetical protein